MKVAISTDTNSGIARESVAEAGIYILAMPVMIDGQMYLEGIDIAHEQLYEAMRQYRAISSSQPSPGQLTELWDGILRDGYDEIVYIPMSSGLSGSCSSAMRLAEDYGGRVQVVDNHRISVTQRESALSAWKLAQRGMRASEIKEYLEARAYDASIYITVDSLEYLKRGGRITPAVAAFATVLNLKPVLMIQGDKLDSYAKARGMKMAEHKMIEAVRQDRATRFAQISDEELIIDVAGTFESGEMARHWREQVQAEFPAASVAYVDLPCSIACHTGMNARGISITRAEAL